MIFPGFMARHPSFCTHDSFIKAPGDTFGTVFLKLLAELVWLQIYCGCVKYCMSVLSFPKGVNEERNWVSFVGAE